MLRRIMALAAGWLALTGLQAPQPPPAELSLWRLDCGEFVINEHAAFFSDTYQYAPAASSPPAHKAPPPAENGWR